MVTKPEQDTLPTGEEKAEQTTSVPSQNPTTEESETPVQQDSLLVLQEEKSRLQDNYMRLVAEFENYKKRKNKEFLDLTQTASKRVILSMLEVLDDADRAEKQISEAADVAALKEGVVLIFEKLRRNLKKLGVQKLESKNTPFDTEKHEAVTEFPVTEENQKNTVIDVVEEGYLLYDKLIRFAKVVVGK